MGAVMGYSEQHTLLLMTSDEEVETFLNVGQSPAQLNGDIRLLRLLVGSGRARAASTEVPAECSAAVLSGSALQWHALCHS
jgi:hypothetical protein